MCRKDFVFFIICYKVIDVYLSRGVGRGGRGVSDPPIQKYRGGEVCFAPPHEICINKFYIY